MKVLLAVFVAIVILGGGAYALLHKSDTTTSTPPSTSTSTKPATPTTQTPATTPSAANTITYNGSQFTPATLTVKAGTTMTIKNSSSQALQMQSDPHPTHTDDSDLNIGLVAAGQSQTFTVTKIGSFGYHNHLDPSIRGKITIE